MTYRLLFVALCYLCMYSCNSESDERIKNFNLRNNQLVYVIPVEGCSSCILSIESGLNDQNISESDTVYIFTGSSPHVLKFYREKYFEKSSIIIDETMEFIDLLAETPKPICYRISNNNFEFIE